MSKFIRDSTVTPLLFVLVLEEVIREARQGGVKEVLYADDLVLTSESREEFIPILLKWKRAMESKGLKISMEKTIMMVNGSSKDEQASLCSVWQWSWSKLCSIIYVCTQYSKWCQKRCCEIQQRIRAQIA